MLQRQLFTPNNLDNAFHTNIATLIWNYTLKTQLCRNLEIDLKLTTEKNRTTWEWCTNHRTGKQVGMMR